MDKTILIVDDDEMERKMICDILSDEYYILEAESGKDALKTIESRGNSISGIVLDYMMPEVNGLEVLEKMKATGMIKKIPVLVLTGDKQSDIETKCLTLGAVDYMRKPIEALLIKTRVTNACEINAYKKDLEAQVAKQMDTLQKQNRLLSIQAERIKKSQEKMGDVLGSIVEYRNVESGDHVLKVKEFTRIIARCYMELYPDSGLTNDRIDTIVSASALHDVGKISIPDSVLLKPGRLDEYEYELIKSHTIRGAEMLENVDGVWSDEFKRCCANICKYHHEKYDGEGYPYGIVGDEIPLEAQLVSIADVYDALVSERIYKKAYSFDKSFHLIITGEAGVFSPKILECFRKSREKLEKVALTYADENAIIVEE
ncbi:MAG: response regulator [Lachnospiraceae bacterium]|nr:response regulator [Lachnospiraceae bacterium]